MKTQKIGVIIQARMGSTRLPGKVLKFLSENETVLDVLIKRLKLSNFLDEIIIATTLDPKNSVIINVAKSYNVSYFVGSEENVLERYYQAAKEFDIDIVIRVTSDCPFIDPKVLDNMIEFYLKNDYDFVRNTNREKTTNFPIGFDIEIFSFEVLEEAQFAQTTDFEKEHVTDYIHSRKDEFKIFYYDNKNLKRLPDLRLTIDEQEDLIMCREVYNKLKERGKGIDFTIYDVITLIDENPEIMNINKHLQHQ